jgi:ribonuclease HIII
MTKNPLPSIFVTTVDISIAEKMLSDLKEQSFEITAPLHTIFSAKKKGISCTLYKSGKLTVQGKEMAQFVEFYLEPEVLKSFDFTHQSTEKIDQTGRIGIDESGKGDFFGPLCIAGVFAEGDGIAGLKKIGVRDSKALSDSMILKIAKQIRENFLHHIVKINPLKYNELYRQFRNLNHLLAWGHATTIEHLVAKSKCTNVIVDQFAGEHIVINALKRKRLEVTLAQRHRAEEDLVVAAASILARETFLNGLESLGQEFGIKLPKGASAATIQAGKNLVRQYGKEVLEKVGKMHFKTLDAILGIRTE